jgi:signal transduction histidine kinase
MASVMALLETVGAVALDGVAVALLAATTWTVFQSREKPSAPVFLALLVTLTLWSVVTLTEEILGSFSDGLVALGFDLGVIGPVVAIPAIWTIYALGYTGRGTGLTRRRLLMLGGVVVPIVLAVIVLLVSPSESIAEGTLVLVLAIELFYLFALFVYATYLLVGITRKQARVSKRQVGLLTFAVSAPYLLGGSINESSPADGLTLGLLVAGGLLAFAVRRYPVLTGFLKTNDIARNRVVEGLQEAVIVLDWEDHVLDANTATTELFDVSTAAASSVPLGSFIEELEDRNLEAGATGTVSLQTTKGLRRFQYSVSAVQNTGTAGEDDTEPVARTLVLRDVTDRETREQRLSVLNRVLRHNVRNKLDVILARADLIADKELRQGIRESATDLLELSNKARDAEAMMMDKSESPEQVDVPAVVRGVAEEFRTDTPDADISVTCPGELMITSHRAILENVLAELVENALVHTDDDRPSVEITVSDTPAEAVELSVADDGPGIPEREQQILASGTETQLEHAQGIGLWFVNWAVRQLGGDLSFAENDPKGSIVTVRLYRRSRPSASGSDGNRRFP